VINISDEYDPYILSHFSWGDNPLIGPDLPPEK